MFDFDESFTKVIMTHSPPYYLKCLWAYYNMKKTKDLCVKKKVIKECSFCPLQDKHVPKLNNIFMNPYEFKSFVFKFIFFVQNICFWKLLLRALLIWIFISRLHNWKMISLSFDVSFNFWPRVANVHRWVKIYKLNITIMTSKKITTISIWIFFLIFNGLMWSVNSVVFEPLYHAFTS